MEEGTVFGFLGHNGAGKTTTIKILVGVIYPTSGEAFFWGKPVSDVKAKTEIGFLPESPYFYDYLTGSEFLHFCGQLFGMGLKERTLRVDALTELVNLKGSEKEQLRTYSKGMLQRMGLAQALINDPKLVILDEPMSGLDPIGRKDVRDIMIRLKDEGKTIFFSTHVLSDAEMICDQVAIIIKGRLRNTGRLEEMLDPKVKSIDVRFSGVVQEKVEWLRPYSSAILVRSSDLLITLNDEAVLPKVIQWAHHEKANIVSIVPKKESLEDIFIEEMKEAG